MAWAGESKSWPYWPSRFPSSGAAQVYPQTVIFTLGNSTFTNTGFTALQAGLSGNFSPTLTAGKTTYRANLSINGTNIPETASAVACYLTIVNKTQSLEIQGNLYTADLAFSIPASPFGSGNFCTSFTDTYTLTGFVAGDECYVQMYVASFNSGIYNLGPGSQALISLEPTN